MEVCEAEVGDEEEKVPSGNEKGEGESYVAQLHQVFLSCDTSGCGYLRKAELIELCSQLHLEDQTGLIVRHLLGDQPDAKVDFDDFKEKFVCLLSESVSDVEGVVCPGGEDSLAQEDRLLNNNNNRRKNLFQSPEREVSPRYVWGSKKYGRRSRPEIDVLDANYLLNSDFSEPEEVFLFDSNDDGLSSGAEEGGGAEEDKLEEQSLGVRDRRRSSWAHSPSTPASIPRQGAKRRRRMRSSEDRSSLDSDNQECVKWSSCEVGVGDSTLPACAPSDEEYLQSIWLKLGVGADGCLNKDGLIRVCEHIGMEKLSEEVISQLFEKLDVDQDGQISFDEFLHLFRNGEANHTAPTVCEVKGVSGECPRASTVDPSGAGSDAGLFHVLVSECSRPGYVEPEVIVELWDSLGITSGYAVLRHLGLSSSSPVNLLALSNLLEESLQSPRMSSRETEVCQAALATFNQELKYLRKSVEQLATEREKLRGDVAEANGRATLMAQEVDDHQLKLETSSQLKITNIEKKYQEQLRLLQEELESEREAFNKQLTINKRNSGDEMSSLKESELRLREKLNLAQNENRLLEEEVGELSQRLTEAQRVNQSQQIEAESLLAYKTEVTYEEQLRLMSGELESVRLENKQLKDQNDELSTQLEAQRSKPRSVSEEDPGLVNHRRNGSWLADYIKDQGSAHVHGQGRRRGSGPFSSTESDTLIIGHPSLDAVNEGDPPHMGLAIEDRHFPFNLSDEDEYLELNSQVNRSVAPSDGGQQVDTVILYAFANKMKLKKVFGILKQRFVEMHLEESAVKRPELRRMDAVSPAEEEESKCGGDSGVDTPTPHLKSIVGEDGWWGRSVDSEDEESALERERARWRSAMEEQCEEMRGHQARTELAFKIDMLKSEVYWREQVERERGELERERVELQDKVLSLEFQLANSMKMLRERDHGMHVEESDDEDFERRAPGRTSGSFLGRSRSWKEYGGRCSSTERRRRRWLKSKNNLEALDIESDPRSRKPSQNSADASDEDDDYQASKKSLHHDAKSRAQRRSNPSLFEKLMLERGGGAGGSGGGSPGSAKSNCVIDMNVLHSINQHLSQQEKRNHQLETTLKERTLQTERLINETKKRYEEEIQRVTQLLHRTRSFLKEQTLKVKGQGEKLFQSENAIKELSWENSELVKLLQISEEKRLKSEKLNYGLKQKCEALNQLVSEMYRIQTT